jgi:hypothetical protein
MRLGACDAQRSIVATLSFRQLQMKDGTPLPVRVTIEMSFTLAS